MNWDEEFKTAVARRRKIPTLSLFSGAGGLDLGFHLAGFDIRAAVEIEDSYCETLRHNTGKGRFYGSELEVYCEDIKNFARDFDSQRFRASGIECIIGGPPCQTFSAAGRRSGGVLGTDDERGQLFRAYCDILDALQPQAFVFENVYGLPGANGGTAWREIVTAFSELGYTLVADVLDAADYGVPQHRERLIMVGFRDGNFRFPLPTHGPDTPSNRALVSAMEAIADLQDIYEPEHDSLGGRYGHLLPLVPPGLNYSFFTAEMGHPEPLFAWRSKFHDFLHKADPNSPVRTIKARPGKFTGPFHWKNRHFTANELRRLQSFPDYYEIRGNYNTVVEQVGNSVPPRMAAAIALSVREQLFDGRRHLSLPPRPEGFASTFRQRQRERNLHFRSIAEKAHATGAFVSAVNSPRVGADREEYRLLIEGFFNTEIVTGRKRMRDPFTNQYSVNVEQRGAHISVNFDETGEQKGLDVKITVSGLAKYLINIDSLDLSGEITDLVGLFHAWSTIQRALVSRSKFFTLIDIYGHYANRGDTVQVDAVISSPSAEDALLPILNYFSNTDSCGVFHDKIEIAEKFDLSVATLDEAVRRMRALRYDVRTRLTHPTIASSDLICTYPFPLLSPKAHLERRVASVIR